MCGRIKRLLKWQTVLVLLVLDLSAASAPPPLAASPTELGTGWVSRYFDEMRLLWPGGPFFITTGPCERLDLARWLQSEPSPAFSARSRAPWLDAMLRRELAPEMTFLESGKPLWVLDSSLGLDLGSDVKPKPAALTRFWLHAPEGFSLWTSLRVTANAPDYHRVQTEPWKDRWRASLDYGGLGYQKGGLALFAGRDEVSWGVSRDAGLLFSGSAPVMDMLKLTFRTRRFLFTSLHSELRRGRTDPWDETVRRFVAAHRLEVLPGCHWDVSVSEVVVYGGPGRDFEPGYLNPLAPLYAQQWNSNWNDNILVSGDVLYRIPGRAELRGELLVDDFQIDPHSEPNKAGFGIAAVAVNPLLPERSSLACSYYRIANRTYGHEVAWNMFVQEGSIMGFPGGPDGDRFGISSSWAPIDPLELSAVYDLTRQGEGRVTDPQVEPGKATKFPSGTVATTHAVTAGITWRPWYCFELRGLVQWSVERNVDNVKGSNRDRFKAAIGLTSILRTTQAGG